MPFLDQRTLSVARTILVLAAVGAFIYGARHTLIAFLLAIFFAYLVDPLVSHVERWHAVSRGSRAIAIAEVYIILAAIVAGIVLSVGPYIASEGRRLIAAAPLLLGKFGSGEIVQKIGSTRGWSYETQLYLERFILQYRSVILNAVKQLGLDAGALATETFWLVLIPILSIAFLKDGEKIVKHAFTLLRLRPRARRFAAAVAEDVNDMAANYIRAQLMLVGLALVAYTIILTAMRVQYGTILGITAGVLEFIPVVGPLVGAIAILAVAFLTGFHHLWILALLLGTWRLVQDYVNAPRLMHRNVELHPQAVIFVVLSGGEIAGVLGVFLAIPVAATLQILWRRWQAYSDPEDESVDVRPSRPRAA